MGDGRAERGEEGVVLWVGRLETAWVRVHLGISKGSCEGVWSIFNGAYLEAVLAIGHPAPSPVPLEWIPSTLNA